MGDVDNDDDDVAQQNQSRSEKENDELKNTHEESLPLNVCNPNPCVGRVFDASSSFQVSSSSLAMFIFSY